MIKSFRHKGLKLFFETGKISGIQASQAHKIRQILGLLDVATDYKDMDLPMFRLHELKGSRKGIWSVRVSGNWRITFKFIGSDAEIVNYEDYH